MAHKVIMPVLGMNQDTGTIAEWVKKEGDFVEAGDVLLAVETDKAIQDIEAGVSGYLCEIKYPAGTDVPVGEIIASITDQIPVYDKPLSGMESVSNKTKQQERVPGLKKDFPENEPYIATKPAVTDSMVASELSVRRNESNLDTAGQSDAYRTLASPKAKRIARELGIKVEQVAGNSNAPIHSKDVIVMAKCLIRSGLQGGKETFPKLNNAQMTVKADATNIQNCDAWLREKTTNISMGHLVATLAVIQLRAIGFFKSNDYVRVLVDIWSGEKIESSVVVNPDKFRVSQLEIQKCEESESADMRVICVNSSRISNLELTEYTIPTLTICANDKNLSAHMLGFQAMYTPDVMKFSDNLAFALEQPLIHLV